MSNEKNLVRFLPTTTFTPVFADAASGGNVLTGTIGGKFTVNGDICILFINADALNTAGATAGNTLYIRNLPFTAAASAQGSLYTYLVTRAGQLSPSILSGTSTISIVDSTSAAENTVRINALVSGSSSIYVTISYLIA